MPVSDFLNASDLINQPWTTIFSCFVDLLGTPFYLIPVSVIGAAIYIKQRNLAVVSMYLLASVALLSSGSIFVGKTEMILVYIVLIALGIGGVFIGFLLRE